MAKKKWERDLPSPPQRAAVLRSVILQHIKWFEARPVPAIHQCVLDDYGTITDRTVYRHLAVLAKEGKIVKVQDDQEDTFGYVRARRPYWDRVEQVYT
jgi:Fe2+ or Zn2+ uptake regulation protein